MPNDTTLKSVFDHAKLGVLNPGKDFPSVAVVYATLVEHLPGSHPSGSPDSADKVNYSNGPLKLSADKKTLSGEFQRWSNVFVPTNPFADVQTPPDVFPNPGSRPTVAITVSDSGQVTFQPKLDGKPIGGMPPVTLDAVYDNGLFVEKQTTGLRSLSFTLGSGQAPN
jgi:hypothetical protein